MDQSLVFVRSDSIQLFQREITARGFSGQQLENSEQVFKIESTAPPTHLIFAQQLMTRVTCIRELSVSKLSALISEKASQAGVPCAMHIFDSGTLKDGESFKRVALLKEQVKTKRAFSVRPTELVLQCFVEKDGTAYISISQPSELLSPLVAGYPVMDERPAYPSRAYRKLVEAQLHLQRAFVQGERCYDLGASPGGWTAVALDAGVSVVAVDRSPLSEELMRHRLVEFKKGDAFSILPNSRIDWLVSDVAAFPEKSFELLRSWIERGLCKHFVLTLKFTGQPDIGLLLEVERFLENTTEYFFLRRLLNNKNEVTAAGWC